MSTASLTLPDFLLARIAEDESLILNGWDSDGKARIATMWTGPAPGYTTVASDHHDEMWIADNREVTYATNITVLFDPARVLAECAAKRQIIKHHEDWPVLIEQQNYPGEEFAFDAESMVATVTKKMAWVTEQEYIKRFGVEPPTGQMLLALAQVYADHPDFNPGWQL